MSRTSTWIRVLWMASVLAVAFTLPARADAPSGGPTVRIQAFAIESGWHEGKLVKAANGCTMIDLVSPSADGYKSVALVVVDWLEVRRNGGWSTLVVERLLSKEPAVCREAAAG